MVKQNVKVNNLTRFKHLNEETVSLKPACLDFICMQEVSFYLRTLTCLCTDVPLFGSVLTDLRETLTGLNRVTCAGL